MGNCADQRCRACLKEWPYETMYPLVIEDTATLFSLTAISFREDDRMPQQICSTCYKSCLQWNDFRVMAVGSANVLQAEKELESSLDLEVNDGEDVEINLFYEDSDEDGVEMEDLQADKPSDMDNEQRDSDEDTHGDEQKGGQNDNPLICPVCGKVFKTKVTLNQHQLTHDRDKMRYECNTCKKRFLTKSLLVIHTRVHTGEKPFICKVCDKSFSQHANLKTHELYHKGEKPFKCSVCEKPFTGRSNLIIHERIHTGERPFICKVCDKSFNRKQTLIGHLRTHTEERPFNCSLCSSSFKWANNLKAHLKTHESKSTTQDHQR